MNGHFPCDANNYHTIPSDGLNVSMVIDLIWHPSGLPAPEHWALVLVKLSDSCMCSKSLHLRPTLCKPMDYSPPGSTVHGILQARILEWVAMLSLQGDPANSGVKPESLTSPALAGGFFSTSAAWEAVSFRQNQYQPPRKRDTVFFH